MTLHEFRTRFRTPSEMTGQDDYNLPYGFPKFCDVSRAHLPKNRVVGRQNDKMNLKVETDGADLKECDAQDTAGNFVKCVLG